MEDLERSVSRDEIRRAVWSCGDNKSPGPDGFTFEFFKKYWDCIGSDFCEAVEYFFVNSSFSKGCNSSFVALIPKVMDAKFRNDFRPISLIGSVYKVVTKMARFILDVKFSIGVKERQKALSLNVRLPKHTTRPSILINGSPSKEYSCHRGLKQGDPLAPYLFILIMESLHLSFNRVVDEGLFKGIQLPGSLSLSHLFYADDAMFIGEWSNENLSGIINILKSFFLASGLQINILKSQLLGVCVPHQVVEQAASLIGCSIMSNKFRYLGVMVGEYSSRIKAWDDVILKLRSRLSKWKSLSGRNARGGIEEHLLADLTSLMDSVTLSNSGDRWVCDLVSDGNFRVKEIRNYMRIFSSASSCQLDGSNTSLLICEELFATLFRCDLAQLVLRRICRWWGLDPHDWSSFQEWQSWILSIQFSSKVKAMLK
ncbi:RNA-directed DNA polymerase, eukaryota [Tanacetum coccineum]